jgi:hypothetical protein
MIATLLLTSLLSLPTVPPANAESGITATDAIAAPRAPVTLGDRLARVKPGSTLQLQFVDDFQVMDVEFAGFDAKRSTLRYWDRTGPALRDQQVEVDADRLSEVRLLRHRKSNSGAVLGLIGGAAVGLSLSSVAALSGDDERVGRGVLIGSFSGLLLGFLIGDGEPTEATVWRNPDANER